MNWTVFFFLIDEWIAVGADFDAQVRAAHSRHSGVGLRQPALGVAHDHQHQRLSGVQFHRRHSLRRKLLSLASSKASLGE